MITPALLCLLAPARAAEPEAWLLAREPGTIAAAEDGSLVVATADSVFRGSPDVPPTRLDAIEFGPSAAVDAFGTTIAVIGRDARSRFGVHRGPACQYTTPAAPSSLCPRRSYKSEMGATFDGHLSTPSDIGHARGRDQAGAGPRHRPRPR